MERNRSEMVVLVSVATKHGATDEIGRAIANSLEEVGVETVVLPPEAVEAVDGFDAVVVGSAIYAGHWLESAKRLIETHGDALKARPVWLFSSGPLGEPPKPAEEPADVAALRERTGARDHRVFAGKIEQRQLSFAERAIVAVVRAPNGDFRPWSEINAWSAEIARTLQGGPHRTAAGDVLKPRMAADSPKVDSR